MLSNQNKVISVTAKKYILIPVKAKDDNGIINPTPYTVALAFLAQETQPNGLTTWYTASWVTVVRSGFPTIYKAKLLIGPGGAIALTVGSWDVWIRVSHPVEVPVEKSDTILIV